MWVHDSIVLLKCNPSNTDYLTKFHLNEHEKLIVSQTTESYYDLNGKFSMKFKYLIKKFIPRISKENIVSISINYCSSLSCTSRKVWRPSEN